MFDSHKNDSGWGAKPANTKHDSGWGGHDSGWGSAQHHRKGTAPHHQTHEQTGWVTKEPAPVKHSPWVQGEKSDWPTSREHAKDSRSYEPKEEKEPFLKPFLDAYNVLQKAYQAGVDLSPDSMAGLTDIEKIGLPLLYSTKQTINSKLWVFVYWPITTFIFAFLLTVTRSEMFGTIWMIGLVVTIGVYAIGYLLPDILLLEMRKFSFGKNKKIFYTNLESIWGVNTIIWDALILVKSFILGLLTIVYSEPLSQYLGVHFPFSMFNIGFAYIEESIKATGWLFIMNGVFLLAYKVLAHGMYSSTSVERKLKANERAEQSKTDVDVMGEIRRELNENS